MLVKVTVVYIQDEKLITRVTVIEESDLASITELLNTLAVI